MRRFILRRLVDTSGASGTGIVAQGVEFDTGDVAMRWLTPVASVVIFPNVRQLRAIHGHGGDTEFVFLDDEEFPPMEDGQWAQVNRALWREFLSHFDPGAGSVE